MLVVINGGKSTIDEKKEQEKARVRAMFESKNNNGYWTKNSTEQINVTAEEYSGKLKEAMLKHGSFRGKKKNAKNSTN